jgi:hypothetical protein
MTHSDRIGYLLHFIFGAVLSLPFIIVGGVMAGVLFVLGFSIGIEWMQQIRMLIEQSGKTWPAIPTLKQVVMAFVWKKQDRYFDVVSFVFGAAALGVAYGSIA